MTKVQIEIACKQAHAAELAKYPINYDAKRYNLTKPVFYNYGDYPPKPNANESLKAK